MATTGEMKVRVRMDALERVREMGEEARAEASEQISHRLLSSDLIDESMVTLLYAPLEQEEPQIHRVAETLVRRGAQVAAPLVDWQERSMDAWLVKSLDVGAPLGMVDVGERVPRPTEELGRVGVQRIGTVVTPLAATDILGHRVGRGGGFYDEFLPRCGRAKRIGVAFEVQIVPESPNEDHDAPLDVIVTEERVIFAPTRRG